MCADMMSHALDFLSPRIPPLARSTRQRRRSRPRPSLPRIHHRHSFHPLRRRRPNRYPNRHRRRACRWSSTMEGIMDRRRAKKPHTCFACVWYQLLPTNVRLQRFGLLYSVPSSALRWFGCQYLFVGFWIKRIGFLLVLHLPPLVPR